MPKWDFKLLKVKTPIRMRVKANSLARRGTVVLGAQEAFRLQEKALDKMYQQNFVETTLTPKRLTLSRKFLDQTIESDFRRQEVNKYSKQTNLHILFFSIFYTIVVVLYSSYRDVKFSVSFQI